MNEYIISRNIILSKDERVIKSTNRSLKSFILWYIFALLWIFFGLFFPILFIMGVASIFITLINKQKSRYVITNKKVISNTPTSLGKNKREIGLNDIYHIKIIQNIFSESMNYGDIEFKTLKGDKLVFKGIDSPEKWKDFVLNIQKKKTITKR